MRGLHGEFLHFGAMPDDWHERNADDEPPTVHPLGWHVDAHPHDAASGVYDMAPRHDRPGDAALDRSMAVRARYYNGSPMSITPRTCEACGREWIAYYRTDAPPALCRTCEATAAAEPGDAA
jgi:hypothetical protein